MPIAQKIFGQFFIWFFHDSWNSGHFLENPISGFLKKIFFIFLKDGYQWGKQPLERAKFSILAHLASRGDRPAQIMVRLWPTTAMGEAVDEEQMNEFGRLSGEIEGTAATGGEMRPACAPAGGDHGDHRASWTWISASSRFWEPTASKHESATFSRVDEIHIASNLLRATMW